MNKFVKFSVIGFMILSTVMWSAGSALAVSVAADYTKSDVATNTIGRGDTNQLVFNVLLNNDVLITNGGGASAAGNALATLQGATDPVFVDGTSNDNTYTNGEAVIYSVDLTLDAGVLSGAGTDDVLIAGPSDIKPFPGTIYGLDAAAGTDGAYDAGEVLISSADTNLTNGDTVVTAGTADVTNFIAADGVLFDDGAEWDTGVDDIFIDSDNDDVYTTAADALIDNNADAPAAGATTFDVVAGDQLCSDNVVGTLATAVWTYTGTGADVTACTADDVVGVQYLGAGAAAGGTLIVTGMNWASSDNVLDGTTDLYEENVAEQLTYSAAADVVLYNGSGTLTLGDAGSEMGVADAEAIYLDSDHGGTYTNGEPIIDLGNGNTLADDGNLPLTAIFLAKATGNWTVD
ncbi:MAG: hypothetical protein WCW90_02640 [Candidatus Paceibacterota bacterium]